MSLCLQDLMSASCVELAQAHNASSLPLPLVFLSPPALDPVPFKEGQAP